MNRRLAAAAAALVAASAGLACGSSSNGTPDAAAVLHADGYTQMAVPGFTVADGHHISANLAGDGLQSEAIGVSPSNPDLYQEVQVYATPVSSSMIQPGGMLGGPHPGVTIATQGNAVTITGALAALGNLSGSLP